MSTANVPSDSTSGMKLIYINQLASEPECQLQQELKELGASVAKVKQIDDVLERLRSEYFDAVLVDLDDVHAEDGAALRRVQHEAPEVPVFVLGDENDFDDDRRAMKAIEDGAHDFVIKSKIQDVDLAFRIRAAWARQVRKVATLNAKIGAASSIPQPLEAACTVCLPVRAIALSANGAPDVAQSFTGRTIEVTENGLRVELKGTQEMRPGAWVVGVKFEGRMRFAYVTTNRIEQQSDLRQVEFEFAAEDQDLFAEENLTMHFDAHSRQFTTRAPHHVLAAWVKEGVLYTTVVDKELVCPSCHGSATFRYGCRACGSGRLTRSNLIHHFACAHIDTIDAFEQEGQICCPKCRARDLVIGADFEFLAGPFDCESCSWSDVQAELVGECLSCQDRFPMHQALEREHLQFHVDRLDPLAVIAANG